MKKLAVATLSCFLGLMLSPLAFAVPGDAETDWSDYVCNFGSANYVHTDDGPAPPGFFTALQEDLADVSEEIACGEINPVTRSLEPSDCTKNGQVITEITEAFAGGTSIDDGENFVMDVYTGICCSDPYTTEIVDDKEVTYEITQCAESRNVYSTTLNGCQDLNAIGCEKRQWIVGTSGAGILKVYVKQMYTWGAGIVGFVAVVVMVISGIQISVSGVAGDITSAKQRIFQSIGGLVLLFMSGIILYSINPTFFS